jgi:restriction endonuclease S subunit
MAVPSLREQERVAHSLDGFTTTIEAHGDHVDAVRALRNAVSAKAWEASGRAALGDVGRAVTGQTPSTKQSEFWNPPEVPFVTPGDFDGRLLIDSSARQISAEGAAVVRALDGFSLAQVCIGATIGKVAVVVGRATANQQVNALVDLAREDAVFLAAVLSCERGQTAVKGRAGQTTMPIIKKSAWQSVEVPWPPAEERRALADIVEALDRIAQESDAATRQLLEARRAACRRCSAIPTPARACRRWRLSHETRGWLHRVFDHPGRGRRAPLTGRPGMGRSPSPTSSNARTSAPLSSRTSPKRSSS